MTNEGEHTGALRLGVVAVVCDAAGRILAGQRNDRSGGWQLPQGGIERGETPEAAVVRELREEIGVCSAEIVRRGEQPVEYLFPPEVTPVRGFLGQRQHWFLLRLAPAVVPNLEQSDGTFAALQWVTPARMLELVIAWKAAAYRAGLASIGLGLEPVPSALHKGASAP